MRLTARWRPQPTRGTPSVAVALDPVDSNLLVTARANALIVGPPATVAAVLSQTEPQLREPVVRQRADSGAELPWLTTGTLILEDVAALSRARQDVLLQWLGDAGRAVRVVSTADEPVFPLVEAGRFLGDLYYRLNLVMLDLRPQS